MLRLRSTRASMVNFYIVRFFVVTIFKRALLMLHAAFAKYFFLPFSRAKIDVSRANFVTSK